MKFKKTIYNSMKHIKYLRLNLQKIYRTFTQKSKIISDRKLKSVI